ncbi:MAG TPA: ABC transporter permease subunit [Thermoplasmata archaeon]|nr:ABC transporter permease subunit [Thermoplasmata archaeon]
MNRLLSDLYHHLSAPSIVLVLLLLVVGSGVLVASESSRSFSESFSLTVTYSSEYEFAYYVFDGSGLPVRGVAVSIALHPANSSGPAVGSASGTTSADGLATLEIAAPDRNYTVDYSVASGPSYYGFGLRYLAPGAIRSYGAIAPVEVGDFALTPYVLLAFPAPGGGVISGLSAGYYIHEPNSSTNLSGALGSLTAVPQRVHITIPGGIPSGSILTVFVTNGTRKVVASFAQNTENPPGAEGPGGNVLLSWIGAMQFFGLTAATLIGYLGYARERVAGTLEPLLALPMDRLRIPIVRFVSSVAVLAIGVTASTAFLVYWLDRTFAIGTPAVLVGTIWVGAMAEGVALIGVVFLISHLVRSYAAVLAVGLTLTVAFSILWMGLTDWAAAQYGVPSSVWSSIRWQGQVGVLSPTHAALNPVEWSLRLTAPGSSQLLATYPSPIVAGLAMLLWALLPFAGALWLARWRD